METISKKPQEITGIHVSVPPGSKGTAPSVSTSQVDIPKKKPQKKVIEQKTMRFENDEQLAQWLTKNPDYEVNRYDPADGILIAYLQKVGLFIEFNSFREREVWIANSSEEYEVISLGGYGSKFTAYVKEKQ